jgi:chorismate mutase
MPPNNNSLTSSLSRQMQRLRKQVDQIDLRMLRLLQQRNKLAGDIGRIKRRHRAVIYVPERERALLVRLVRTNKGKFPPSALVAIYREILSASRASQGQDRHPIGLLASSASVVLPAAKEVFGKSDRFVPMKSWNDISTLLKVGGFSIGLVTAADLLAALRRKDRWRDFSGHLTVSSAVPIATGTKVGTDAVLTITPPGNQAGRKANRFVILIECKSTRNAIKTLFRDMPDLSLHDESSTTRPTRAALSLACLHTQRPVDAARTGARLRKAAEAAGVSLLILGSYLASED